MGFERTISTGEWPQNYALGRAATGTGKIQDIVVIHVYFPLATETGISLIILALMRILQRNLKQTYLIV
jgi:hypothetical protein